MLCRTACNLHLSQVDPHNTVAIDAVHVPLPIYRSTCSRCLPEWLNIGKVKAICSDVEQPRLVLNEHGQLWSEFVYCVIEVVMQMVVGVNLVVSQFVQQQRVVLKGTRRVVVEEVYHHDAPLTHEPFFRLIPTEATAKATFDMVVFVIDEMHDHGLVDKFRANHCDQLCVAFHRRRPPLLRNDQALRQRADYVSRRHLCRSLNHRLTIFVFESLYSCPLPSGHRSSFHNLEALGYGFVGTTDVTHVPRYSPRPEAGLYDSLYCLVGRLRASDCVTHPCRRCVFNRGQLGVFLIECTLANLAEVRRVDVIPVTG